MGRQGSIPWSDIKNEYVRGIEREGKRVYPTQRELAEKYDINGSTIAIRCKKEDWLSERQIVSSKIQAKSEQKTIEQISNKGVDFDLKCFTQAQQIRDLIQAKLTDELKPQELAALVKALKDNQSYAKEALGESGQETEKIIIEIERANGNKD